MHCCWLSAPASPQVLGYLALLRLSELGFADFRALIKSQESHTMCVFLRFLFNEENLDTWLRPEWLKHYEPGFVDDQLVAKARAWPCHLENSRGRAACTGRHLLCVADSTLLVPWTPPRASPPPIAAFPPPIPFRSSPTRPTDRCTPAQALVFVPQVEPLLHALEGAIADAAAKREAEAEAVRLLAEGKGGKGEHTIPEPFELSEPKLRTVPVPEEAVDVGFTGELAEGGDSCLVV
jgi:hypothetical protein